MLEMQTEEEIQIVNTDHIPTARNFTFQPPQKLLNLIKEVTSNPDQYTGQSILYNLPKNVVESTHRTRYKKWLNFENLEDVLEMSIRKLPNGYEGPTLQLTVKE